MKTSVTLGMDDLYHVNYTYSIVSERKALVFSIGKRNDGDYTRDAETSSQIPAIPSVSQLDYDNNVYCVVYEKNDLRQISWMSCACRWLISKTVPSNFVIRPSL